MVAGDWNREVRAIIFGRADGNAVFCSARRPHRPVVDHPAGLGIDTIIASGEADYTIAIVPDEIVDLCREGVIAAVGRRAPRICVHARAVIPIWGCKKVM